MRLRFHQLGNLDSLGFYWATCSMQVCVCACACVHPPLRSILCVSVPAFVRYITCLLDAHRGGLISWNWRDGCEPQDWVLETDSGFSTTAAGVLKGCIFPVSLFWKCLIQSRLNLLCSWGWPWSLISIASTFYELLFQVCTTMPSSHFLLISGLET